MKVKIPIMILNLVLFVFLWLVILPTFISSITTEDVIVANKNNIKNNI